MEIYVGIISILLLLLIWAKVDGIKPSNNQAEIDKLSEKIRKITDQIKKIIP